MSFLDVKISVRTALKKLEYLVGLPSFKVAKIMVFLPEWSRRRRLLRLLPFPEKNKIQELMANGYSSYSPDATLLSDLLSAARLKAKERLENQTYFHSKKSQLNFLTEFRSDFHPDSPFMKYATDEKLLALVGNYLGGVPHLEQIKLVYSIPHANGAMHSELWHVDRGDRFNLKLFTAIEDVTAEKGPLTILNADDSRVVHRKNYFRGRVSDEEMETLVPKSNWRSLLMKAGEAVFVDTERCYHFGSRSQQPRLILICWYSSGFGYHKRDRRISKGLENYSGRISPLQELVMR